MEHALDVAGAELEERHRRAGVDGDVDQAGDAAELAVDDLERLRDGALVADIRGERDRTAARGLDLAHHRRRAIGALTVDDRDGRPRARGAHGKLGAEPAAATGDHQRSGARQVKRRFDVVVGVHDQLLYDRLISTYW